MNENLLICSVVAYTRDEDQATDKANNCICMNGKFSGFYQIIIHSDKQLNDNELQKDT